MTNQTDTPVKENTPVPTPQTLFRLVGLRNDLDKTLQGVYRATSATADGAEGTAFKRILEAPSAVDVVRLAPLSRGIAQLIWVQRMNEFGETAIPAIVRRLKSSQSIADGEERNIVVERLIAALKRCGAPGGEALLGCFNNLDTYGQSFASVALGVLHVDAAAAPIWRFLQRVKHETQPDHFVGALWALIDLYYPLVDQAMAELYEGDRFYAEQYPFAALAGGVVCIAPLTKRLARTTSGVELYKDERDDVLLALASIGKRVGLDMFTAMLNRYVEPMEGVAAIVKLAAETPAERITSYFKMYFAPTD